MPAHDKSHKLLFSHVEMVHDLLSGGYVPGTWLADADLETLERMFPALLFLTGVRGWPTSSGESAGSAIAGSTSTSSWSSSPLLTQSWPYPRLWYPMRWLHTSRSLSE